MWEYLINKMTFFYIKEGAYTCENACILNTDIRERRGRSNPSARFRAKPSQKGPAEIRPALAPPPSGFRRCPRRLRRHPP